MIVSGGENVFPQEVEDLLAGHDAVAEVAVFGVDDEKFGQRLKAVVVAQAAASVTEDELKDYVKANLAGYKVPRDVVFVDELPRNVDRQGAQARARGGLSAARYRDGACPSAPTSSISAALGLTSGEGRAARPARPRSSRSSSAARRYAVEPELVPVRLDISRTTGNGYALRLRFRPRSTVRACAAWSRRRRAFEVDSREVDQPGGGDELCSPYVDDDELDLARLGARRARARPAGPDHLPPGLRRPVPASAARTSTRTRTTRTRRSRTRAGRSCPRSVRLTFATLRAAMAVPKQKQSHARTEQAPVAAQDHRARVNECPQCRQPRRPHRVCPTLRLLRRSRGRRTLRTTTTTITSATPLDASRSRSRSTRTGPTSAPLRSRAAPRSPPQGGVRVLLFGPAPRDRRAPAPASRSSTRRSRSPRPPTPRAPCARTPDASIVQRRRGRRRRARRRARLRRLHRRRARRLAVPLQARAAASTGPALAIVVPVPGAPFLLLDAGANVEVRPEHLVQFAHMGAAFMEAVMGVARPRVALLSNGEEASQGHARTSSPRTRRCPAPRALNFVGNVEGFAIGTGEADVIVDRRLHRQRRAEGDGGTSAVLLRRGPRRRDVDPRARSSAACCCAPRCASCATRSTRSAGGACCSACAVGVVPHGSFGARGFARAIEVAARGVREDVVGRTHGALAAAGALRQASVRGGR